MHVFLEMIEILFWGSMLGSFIMGTLFVVLFIVGLICRREINEVIQDQIDLFSNSRKRKPLSKLVGYWGTVSQDQDKASPDTDSST
jgi:predicted lipid-binding transport protein (Tim44 family)